jgi:hypothetical protein
MKRMLRSPTGFNQWARLYIKVEMVNVMVNSQNQEKGESKWIEN